jgi:hypothetical protein
MPKSIKLCKNYPWVKRIHVCTNTGPGPLQMGDNQNNVKCKYDSNFDAPDAHFD